VPSAGRLRARSEAHTEKATRAPRLAAVATGAWILGAAAGAIGGGALGYTISAGWSPTAVKISVGVGVVLGGILGALAPVREAPADPAAGPNERPDDEELIRARSRIQPQ
jgi:predicted phage tail protein